MRNLLLLAAFALSFVGCKSPKETSTTPDTSIPAEYTWDKKWVAVPGDEAKLTLLGFKSDACYGECPVYDLVISKTGRAHFNGVKFTEKKGVWQGQLNAEQLKELEATIQDLNYASLEDEYNTPEVTDVPSNYVYVNGDSGPKEIHLRMGYPENMKALLKYINTLQQSIRWERIEVE